MNIPENNVESASNPMNDTSLRRFRRGTILRYGFEVYNAKIDALQKPNLTTQVRMFRDGKIVLEGKIMPFQVLGQIDWQRLRTSGVLSLGDGMQTGDYVLQIVIRDGLAKKKRQIATQFVQFEVVN